MLITKSRLGFTRKATIHAISLIYVFNVFQTFRPNNIFILRRVELERKIDLDINELIFVALSTQVIYHIFKIIIKITYIFLPRF